MNPLVKWPGGKRKMLPVLMPLLEAAAARGCTRLIEPFAGGAAVAFATRSMWGSIVLNDLNADLMNFYQVVRDNPAALAAKIECLEEVYNAHAPALQHVFYLSIRDNRHRPARSDMGGPSILADFSTEAAAQFAFLNRAGYNGLWRVSRTGKQNVPWGKKAKLDLLSNRIVEGSRLLAGAVLTADSYSSISPGQGDVVFVDSPYLNGFTAYTAGGFGLQDHMDLAAWCSAAQAAGATVIITQRACDDVRQIYGGRSFKLIEVQMARAINSDGAGRGKVTELVFYSL